MKFRVCIPTAGTGSRLSELTRYLNKSLVAVANKPVLAHQVEQFPPDTEFVIALGHKGHLVRQFLELAFPERVFHFAEVHPFEGPGSGLGLSLLACKPFLQQPFVFLSCDTLVREAIPAPASNWLGVAARDDLAPYRTVRVEGARAVALCEKGEGQPETHRAYIGLAGIHDHAAFWAAMEAGGAAAINTGEAHGLRALMGDAVAAHSYTWFDSGNPGALALAREAYRQADEPHILPKVNEAIWFVGDTVIKFCDDERFIANRAARAAQLEPYVPAVTGVRRQMYSYRHVQGRVLSACVDVPMFDRLLAQCAGFWRAQGLDAVQGQAFQADCMRFYRDKTLERVAQYHREMDVPDSAEVINGVATPRLGELLEQVDWNALADGAAGRFHGDFHFENILVSDDGRQFTFLDWRQDFAGSLSVGDAYYDLAKLLHGLIVNHELIAADHYSVRRDGAVVRYDLHRRHTLVACEAHFMRWLPQHGYDAKKVVLLTALIFLNIAPLHHRPYCHLLFALGKQMLHQANSQVL
jgi:choline kinase